MGAGKLLALLVAGLMAGAGPVMAEPLPNIDWRQLEETLSDPGDHVVGEELCARPAFGQRKSSLTL